MQNTDAIHRKVETDLDHYTERALPSLQHQWPLLDSELSVLQRASVLLETPMQRETVRDAIVTQLNKSVTDRVRPYLAFLVVKKGRGGEIVGNPYVIRTDGGKQELPYTGLEGYYAGSQRTATRPGLTLVLVCGAKWIKPLEKPI